MGVSWSGWGGGCAVRGRCGGGVEGLGGWGGGDGLRGISKDTDSGALTAVLLYLSLLEDFE